MQYIIKVPQADAANSILAKFPGTMKSIFDNYLSETPDVWNGWTVDRVINTLECDIEILKSERLYNLVEPFEKLLALLILNNNHQKIKTWITLTDPWEGC